MSRAIFGALACCLAACTSAATPADGESVDALETAESAQTSIGVIERNDAYFDNGTKPYFVGVFHHSQTTHIDVDNAALAAKFGDKLRGWDGNVTAFVLYPENSAPGVATTWHRANADWTGRSIGPKQNELNDFVVNGSYARAAFGLETNVGTIWLQHSGNDWACCGSLNTYY